ncbi:hypothetical protein BASA62_005088 [Batrachochytrium salamandrivorans]|nr:hypothetical protein BASA62_005088 [Batrachochytrium salamandrivorans]
MDWEGLNYSPFGRIRHSINSSLAKRVHLESDSIISDWYLPFAHPTIHRTSKSLARYSHKLEQLRGVVQGRAPDTWLCLSAAKNLESLLWRTLSSQALELVTGCSSTLETKSNTEMVLEAHLQ